MRSGAAISDCLDHASRVLSFSESYSVANLGAALVPVFVSLCVEALTSEPSRVDDKGCYEQHHHQVRKGALSPLP